MPGNKRQCRLTMVKTLTSVTELCLSLPPINFVIICFLRECSFSTGLQAVDEDCYHHVVALAIPPW